MDTKTIFACQECGYSSAKWIGRCPACENWNTMAEETKTAVDGYERASLGGEAPKRLFEIEISDSVRIKTGMGEFDRILGGGVVEGGIVLIGGAPGIGKSTLLLQVAENVAGTGKKVLYVSGEESVRQTKLRAERLGVGMQDNLYILSETNLERIKEHIQNLNPQMVIVDSIQILFKPALGSAPGSIGQIRECANELMCLGKSENIATLIVGHITKDGALAGPKVLEHIVDTVLYFEGDRSDGFRVLRSIKNRFGSTNELGIFEMNSEGLKEVVNPSRLFLGERSEGVSGSAVVATINGTRPLLVEIQALVSPSNFGIPARKTAGLDYNRTLLLIAVLEKRLGIGLGSQDVFVSASGGVNVFEPAADVGIAAAVVSNFKNRPVRTEDIFLGEVGLTGELRRVSFAQWRVNEAARVGFKRCLLPKNNFKEAGKTGADIELVPVSTIEEVLEVAL